MFWRLRIASVRVAGAVPAGGLAAPTRRVTTAPALAANPADSDSTGLANGGVNKSVLMYYVSGVLMFDVDGVLAHPEVGKCYWIVDVVGQLLELVRQLGVSVLADVGRVRADRLEFVLDHILGHLLLGSLIDGWSDPRESHQVVADGGQLVPGPLVRDDLGSLADRLEALVRILLAPERLEGREEFGYRLELLAI